MARKTGSDELFRLIHALTKEEKGYFKKFAIRHTTKGNNYLQLFDAINKQTAFEEKLLVKKFKAYPVMKVYLKEMITGSLVQYYQNNHAHVDLLLLIQKVHVLLVKGMQAEALRILDKAIKQAGSMEVFGLSQYLLRLQMEIQLKNLTGPDTVEEMAETYSANMKLQSSLENDMLQWELSALTIFEKLKKNDVFNTNPWLVETTRVQQTPTHSKRSEIIKLQNLFKLHKLEINEQRLFDTAKRCVEAAGGFRQKNDSSFNDVPALNNYILTLGDYGKYQEVIVECDKALIEPRPDKTQYYQLFVRCIIFKSGALLHFGKFEQALDLIKTNGKPFAEAVMRSGDTTRQQVFAFRKIMAFFLTGRHRETWLAIHEVHQKTVLYNFKIDYMDLKMIEIMTQFMMGNFDLVKEMSVKCRKDFLKQKNQSYTYLTMLNFFNKSSAANYKSEAKIALTRLNEYYTTNQKPPRKAFAILRYTYWLEEISGGKTIRRSFEEQFGADIKMA